MNTLTTNLSTQTNTLFDLETGFITPRFKKQMDLVGIVSKQFFPEYDPYHITNVNEKLQMNGCFQKDFDLYKKGDTSNFKINYKQAVSFLNDEYSDREIVMPREKKIANAIFPCGVEATMHKRFHSLQKSLEFGFSYDTIHFIVKDSQDKSVTDKLIQEQYKEMLNNIDINIVIAETDLNIFEAGLSKLVSNPSLGEEYVIITDPTFASKVEMIATSKLEGKKCLGIASAPIKDWNVDMNLYGYEVALGSHEKATIAWASSAWNFKARQVNTEMRAYKTTHVI